jgi:hypothetical protein
MSEKPRIVGVTGGAVGLSAVAPYVVAGTIVLLGLGFWFVYRSPRTAGSCDVIRQRRSRWIIWSATALVVVIDVASFAPRFWYE